jgi:GntR family transcriptional regulator/MocR family aminotransferase
MPRRAVATSRPQIVLDARSPTPLYQQLYDRVRAAILSGQLERGTRLPSTRQLAIELGISRTTVVVAYERLSLEGYLEGRVGQGTLVTRDLPTTVFPAPERIGESREQRTDLATASPRLASRVRPVQEALSPPHWLGTPHTVYRVSEPAIERFPFALWARLLARHARRTLRQFAQTQGPAGYLPLREAIAAHLSVTRGVRCTPDQIIMTSGEQGALDLAVRALINPGDAVWIEDPGYIGARGALLAAEAWLIPVPVDVQGIDVASGRRLAPSARLVAITPSHQFPTGVTMSLGRRLALLQWAREADAWILEDDDDSEYRWSGRPLEALQGLQGLNTDGRVLYIGTFENSLFPAMRLGYLVVPPALVEPLLFLRREIDIHTPILEQLALADFLREGHYARHLRKMLRFYRQRRDLLWESLCAHLGDLLELQRPEAGRRLIGWLPPGIDDRRATDRAAQLDLDVAALSKYCLEPAPRGALLFGFGGASVSGEELHRRMARLATHLRRL